jgi:UDP-glucose 4-epimerase
MHMRVTVTGGAGFIGSHLVDRLLSDGCEVQVIDDLSTGLREQVPDAVQFVHSCITSEPAAQAVAAFAPSHLVHLAAQVDVRVSIEQPVVDTKINVMGTVAMLEAARAGGSLTRAAFASSAAVYGVQQSDAADEGHPKEPISAYGAAKLAAEVYWDQFGRLHGVSTGALRFANVYGPRQSPKGEAGVVSIFCRRHAAGQTLAIYGSGEATRDYLYVGDVVEALVLMLRQKDAESVYNLGTGVETSVKSLVDQIETVSHQPVDVRYETARAGEVARSVLDAKLARLVLGWLPQTNLAQGLATTFGEYAR